MVLKTLSDSEYLCYAFTLYLHMGTVVCDHPFRAGINEDLNSAIITLVIREFLFLEGGRKGGRGGVGVGPESLSCSSRHMPKQHH